MLVSKARRGKLFKRVKYSPSDPSLMDTVWFIFLDQEDINKATKYTSSLILIRWGRYVFVPGSLFVIGLHSVGGRGCSLSGLHLLAVIIIQIIANSALTQPVLIFRVRRQMKSTGGQFSSWATSTFASLKSIDETQNVYDKLYDEMMINIKIRLSLHLFR